MSAPAGWYPDPGGGENLYRWWDGRAWSAATSANPAAAPPPSALGAPTPQPAATGATAGSWPSYPGYGAAQPSGGQPGAGQPLGGQPLGGQPLGRTGGGQPPTGSAYAAYQQVRRRRSPAGWWLAGGALLVALVVVAVLALRSATGGTSGGLGGGQPTADACPTPQPSSASTAPDPNDGRVHGGPVSYPMLGDPWSAPQGDDRVPFGSDVHVQEVLDQANYDGRNHSWVSSVLVAELQAGDGFFTPEQGSKIVVRCIVGTFYGDATVHSHVTKDEAATFDGHPGWVVESHLTFDIPGLVAKGELLIVAIVSAGETSGLYYASIPDTQPQLVQPAREALAELRVDG